MVDSEHEEDIYGEDWDPEDEDLEPLPPPSWRRPVLMAVAALTVLAMGVTPLYSVIFSRPVADNGLEICGFDYCIIQEAMREEGLHLAMGRLANTILDDEAARSLVDEATDYLDVSSVTLRVVDDLEGRLGGVYEAADRVIAIERPVRVWTVLHEVAHVRESGHDEDYQEVLAELIIWADRSGY